MRSFITRAGSKIKHLIRSDPEIETSPSPLADSYISRDETHEQISQWLDKEDTLFHIAGEPGVGKTFLLDWVEDEFDEQYAIERIELDSHHSIQTLAQKVYRTVLNDIPKSAKKGDREVTGVSGSAHAVGGGFSWTRNPPDWTEDQFEYIEALDQMADYVPDDHKRLICLDDVHNVNDDEEKIKDALVEIAEVLGPEVTLVSAGRLQFTGQVPVIRLSTFSEAQSVKLLTNEVPEMEPATARELHDRLSGHPYYLGLLVDIEDPASAIEVPKENIRDYIEEEYLNALTGDEERFLQATSPLTELDEHVCSSVLADEDRFDQVGVRRLLRGLNKRVIVQDRGTGPDGTIRYAIHDKFREFLLRQEPAPSEIHAAAFNFYADQLQSQIASDGTDFVRGTYFTTLCTHHLSALIELKDQQQKVADFLETVLGENGLPFYTATVLLDELKVWPTDDVSDTIVLTMLSALEKREPLARYFFDDEVDRSWGEQLYDQGIFADPDVPHMQYLNSIVDVHPDFVVKVITNLDSDNPNTRRWLISIASDLPADAAAETADVIESWVSGSEPSQQLDFYAIQLVRHLIEHNKTEAALTVLRGVLQAPQGDDELNQQDQQFEQYELHELFQETCGIFVETCGRDFLDVLEGALRPNLVTGTDPEEDPIYGSVASRTPIPDLDYDQDNTGERKHILFTYLSRAAKQWVSADPASDDRKDLITSYLEDPIPAFRRIGLFLLGRHPDTYQDLVADELGEEANYDDSSIQYDFYRLVETAFSSLDDDQQDQVYRVLREGPQDRQWIEDRAAHEAPDREQSKDEIVQERVERWRLKRLYLLDGEVSDDRQEYIDDLVGQYGVPERTASEPYTPSVRGGVVNERGPEDLDTLRGQDAETVLQKCVDWEPPDDRTQLFEEDELEDVSHWGFAKQLQQLVEEQPVAYAEAIQTLEDGKPQYADVVLDAFVDVLQDDGQFPWPPILSFCETVVDDPGQWSSRCRTSIARLIGQGIQAEQTDFPTQYIERVEDLLITLASITELDPDQEQPHSWIGGVGTTESEVRQYGIRAIVSYLIWQDQNGCLEKDQLDDPLRQVIEAKISRDIATPIRTELGRHFRTFWVADEELMRTHLADLFPTDEGDETKELFAATWNGYTRCNPFLPSAYPYLSPYYHHALDLLAEDESDEGWITAKSTASHVGLAYIFEDEPLDEEDSLIALFYEKMSPDTTANLAQALASGLENEDNELHQHWDSVRELWQWRLDQVERRINGIEDAADYHREFRYFLRCLQHTDASNLEDEQELVERTAPFLVHQAPHIRILEEWLAEQSTSYPAAAISVYHAIIKAVPDKDWHKVARSSKDEMRETMYVNAVEAGDGLGSDAYKIANRFAASGYEIDKDFLDSYLGEDKPR
ncbi:ATP-binding protein [Halogeometricum sp. CBA1124]|uniref:ATP-binding protein n=1 Tax=Halogeometricum sp. CBA1124 TaxID=2668071 RepID=UPI00142947DA|nr:ATP-binding protein [Halogeometricum sp. CBA1124]MUV56080.1 ATP-binding protein [Halogeometricum sp. CBA1124]